MPDTPPPLAYSTPNRNFAAAHFWTLAACAAAAAAIFAAVTGFLLLYIALGSHHDGEDAILLGRFLWASVLITSPVGLLLAFIALARREPTLLALTSLLLNLFPALGALALYFRWL